MKKNRQGMPQCHSVKKESRKTFKLSCFSYVKVIELNKEEFNPVLYFDKEVNKITILSSKI